METQTACRLAYDDTRSGEPAIVLMHGLFGDRTHYDAQVRHLSPGHRVVNIDLRGHGASERPAEGYSLDRLAEDVVRVCADIALQRAVFCSHSIPVAARVATRRPDLAAGVILLDSPVLLIPPAQAGEEAMVRGLETHAWREVLLDFFVGSGRAGAAADQVTAAISSAPSFYALPLIREMATAGATGQDAGELAGLACPLLYIHGTVPVDLERLRAVRPDVMVEEMPAGSGHWPMLTAPEQINSALDRFLEVIA